MTTHAQHLPFVGSKNLQPGPAGSPAVGAVSTGYRTAWAGSAEEKKAKASRNKYFVVSLILIAAGVGLIFYYYLTPTAEDFVFVAGTALGGGGLGLLPSVPFLVGQAKKRFEEREEDVIRSIQILQTTETAESDPSMGKLLNLNRLEMNNYHDLTTSQARISFEHGQRAMYWGFGTVLFCVVLIALPIVPDASKLAVAALGAISTTIAGYISRTFLKSHTMAVAQLNRFFSQPLISSYLLTAERIALKLDDPEARGEALMKVAGQALSAAESERNAVSAIYGVAASTARSRSRKRAAAVPSTAASAEAEIKAKPSG
jgi:hypothetical protein